MAAVVSAAAHAHIASIWGMRDDTKAPIRRNFMLLYFF